MKVASLLLLIFLTSCLSKQKTGADGFGLQETPSASTPIPSAELVLSASPSSLNFGNIFQAASPQSLSFSVVNVGQKLATINSIYRTGSDAHFSLTHNCPAALASLQSCIVTATFSPLSSLGFKSTSVVINHNSSLTTTVNLSAVIIESEEKIEISQNSLNFGNLNVSSAAVTQSITVTNSGERSTSLSNLDFLPGKSSELGAADTCGTFLMPHTSCSITFTLSPGTTTGTKNGAFSIVYGDENSVLTVNVSGVVVNGSSLLKFSGDSQTVNLGAQASIPIAVMVIGTAGNVVPGASVSFSVVGGAANGKVSSPTLTTNASGIAQVNYTSGTNIGNVSINAVSGYGTQTFSITTVGVTGYALDFAPSTNGNSQTGSVNTTLPVQYKVLLKDDQGTPVANTTVRFQSTGPLIGTFGGQTYADVLTDAQGFAVAPAYSFSSTQGQHTVRARLLSDASVFRDFSSTATVPVNSPISSTNTSLSLSSSSVTADGMNVVTFSLNLRDMYGNSIPNSTYGNSVVLTPSPSWRGGALNFSGWSYTAPGIYTNSLTVGNQAGLINISASVAGVSLASPISDLSLVPNTVVAIGMTQLSFVTNPITADGASSTTVVVTLRDQFGNPIASPGQTLILSATAGTLVGPSMTYHSATGTYRQLLVAPSSLGTGTSAVSLATFNGASVPGISGTLTLKSGTVNLSKSTFIIPNRIALLGAAGVQTVTVNLVDDNNNFVDLTGVVVTITPQYVSGTIGAGRALTAVTKSSAGIYQSTLTPAGSCALGPCVESFTATVQHSSINGGAVTQIGATTKVHYFASTMTPAAGNSSVTFSTQTAQSGFGASTITALVTLRTSGGNAFAVGGNGAQITVATTLATTPSSVIDNDNGTYTVLIPSPITSQSGTVTISYAGTAITGTTPTLTFFGAVSSQNSLLTISASSLNGPGTISATLFPKDSNNGAIPLANIALSDIEFTQTGQGSFGGAIASSVVGGQAQYTQNFTRTSTPAVEFESVQIGARIRINGVWETVAVSQGLTITPINLAGVTIDCANVGTYRNTHLYVNAGTLTINSMFNGTIPTSGQCAGYDESANNHPFKFASLTVGPTGIVTHSAQNTSTYDYYGLDLESSGYISIQTGGQINSTGKGFMGQNEAIEARTYPNIPMSSSSCPSSSSHSSATSGCAATTYGDFLDPKFPGSGATNTGAHGGGVIRLKSASFTNNGSIVSDGIRGGGGWTGAGGSVKITVTAGSLLGSGKVTTNSFNCGGGACASPGRVYIKASGLAIPLNNIQSMTLNSSLANGSIYLDVPALNGAHTLNHSLDLLANSIAGPNRLPFTSATSLTIPNGVTLNLDAPTSFKDLIIQNGGKITHTAISAFTPNAKIDLTIAQTLDIQAGAIISATGKGYPGSKQHTLSPSYCAIGPADTTAATGFGCLLNSLGTDSLFGGSHYGRGGKNTYTTIWGSPTNPNSYGGGGVGINTTITGSSGGGIIRLAAALVLLNGLVEADGAILTIASTSGAAGGSVKITASTGIQSTSGLQKVRANGSDLMSNVNSSGGGGGGLVYIRGAGASSIAASTFEARGGKIWPVSPNATQAAGADGSVIVSE